MSERASQRLSVFASQRKSEAAGRRPHNAIRHSSFVIRHSPFAIRHSLFAIRHSLFAILLTFLTLALAFNFIIPPYENLDENEHAEVVRYIAVNGRLPIHGQAEAEGYRTRQEASQPPLYYILAAGWARVWRLPTDPHPRELAPGDVVTCGPGDTLYNRATWVHSPYEDAFPWSGPTLTLHATRIFSTLLQTLTVVGVWTLARRAFSTRVATLATCLVAFNPQFLLLASGVNNDNAVIPLATWGLVLAFDIGDRGPTLKRIGLLGLLSGLAGLSKLSGLALFGLGGLAMLIRVLRHRQDFRALVGWSALLIAITGLIVAPWLLRNQRLYGDLTALAPMLEKVGHRDYPMDWNEIKLMALSYWGQLPCAFYPRAVYWPYWLIMALGSTGLALGWRRFQQKQRLLLTLCLVWFSVITLAWVRWNMTTPATGGRLLFPAIAALAVLLAAGMVNGEWRMVNGEWRMVNGEWRMTQWLTILLPIWALVTLRVAPITMFTPPARMPVESAVPNSQAITFGESLHLRGYEATLTEGQRFTCWLTGRAPCTPVLDITLYWQASAPISQNYVMALQLVSPVPGDTELRFNYNHWPGRGNLPTSAMQSVEATGVGTTGVNTLLRDTYRVPLPPSDAPTQAWTLQLAFTEPGSSNRLPVSIDAASSGDNVALALLRVPAAPPRLPVPARTYAYFGANAISLHHAQVTPVLDQWHVQLLWESHTALPTDYTVFVHAYAADGTLLATGDGPPQNGHFPTRLWLPGDSIADAHILNLPADGVPATIAVGLYDPATGERLPITPQNARVENNAAIIWEGSSP